MENNVLIDFETFNEFPDKYLKVDKNSNYYYIKKENANYVAKSKIDNMGVIDSNGDKKIRIIKSYYNVKDGSFVTKISILYDMNGKKEKHVSGNEEIYSLICVLNIKDNDKYYLTQNDIENLLNYEKESEKVYIKKTGK